MAVTIPEVDQAICAIQEGAQSFTVDGVTYNKAKLNELWAIRKDLMSEENRTNGSRPLGRGFKFTGMGY